MSAHEIHVRSEGWRRDANERRICPQRSRNVALLLEHLAERVLRLSKGGVRADNSFEELARLAKSANRQVLLGQPYHGSLMVRIDGERVSVSRNGIAVFPLFPEHSADVVPDAGVVGRDGGCASKEVERAIVIAGC